MPNALHRDAHVLGFALDHPWAVSPSMLDVIAKVISRHAAGHEVDDATLAAALVSRRAAPLPMAGAGVAVIPIYGVIAPRANMLSEMSGGTSFEALGASLREAMANNAVGTIIFDVDSPGGSVAGATEFAAEVLAARPSKPIIAVAQFRMASAAYWLASCATKIYAAPSAQVGSVGVFTIHTEISKALAALGVTKTYIAAGEHKVELNDTTPLTDEARARIQAGVDEAYAMFVGDIAKGRGASTAEVRAGYGQGAMLTATNALAAGMIDGIATLDATIQRAATGDPALLRAQTAAPQDPRVSGQEREFAFAQQRQREQLALELELLHF